MRLIDQSIEHSFESSNNGFFIFFIENDLGFAQDVELWSIKHIEILEFSHQFDWNIVSIASGVHHFQIIYH